MSNLYESIHKLNNDDWTVLYNVYIQNMSPSKARELIVDEMMIEYEITHSEAQYLFWSAIWSKIHLPEPLRAYHDNIEARSAAAN